MKTLLTKFITKLLNISLSDKKRFIILLSIIFLITIISAIMASIIFYPRITNLTVFDELSVASEQLAKANIELSDTIQSLRDEKERLTKQSISKDQREELAALEKRVGIQEITGRGVVITLDDHPDVQNTDSGALCHGANLRDIINVLQLPELEVKGISINGIRLHMQSTINCFADGTTIDTTKMFTPYNIEVIGNADNIISHLKTRSLLPELWRQIDTSIITLEMTRINRMTLPPTLTRPQSQNYIKETNE